MESVEYIFFSIYAILIHFSKKKMVWGSCPLMFLFYDIDSTLEHRKEQFDVIINYVAYDVNFSPFLNFRLSYGSKSHDYLVL